MALSPQISPKNSAFRLYFFLYDHSSSDYLGFYTVRKPLQTLREFFLKDFKIPFNFSLYKNQAEMNLDLSFEDAKVLPFDELYILIPPQSNQPNFKGNPINMQKLQSLLCSVLENIKQSVDMGSNPRVDFRLQVSLKNSNNQNLEKFRTSTKPYPNKSNLDEESKLPITTSQISNIIQTDNEKKLKTRIYVIQEIIKTEENYLKILLDLIETVIKPCQELNYLTKDQEKEIFSNVETIAKFSESFLKALKSAYGPDFDPKKSLFANTIVKMQPFFRYYYPYCINFKDARVILEQLRKENSQFNLWLKNIEMAKWDQVIDAILLEPVQRMPRYVILLKELKKNTHNWHPDYSNIDLALRSFDELNVTVNKHMEEYLNTVKLFELASKYGKHFKDELVNPKRKFLAEEAMTLINDGETKQVVCYFLTDMVLITERIFTGDMKFIKFLTFGQRSYVLNIPNTKHYSHLITIYGEEEGLTFILDSQESKTKIIQFINKSILSEIKNRSNPGNNYLSLDHDELPQISETSVNVKILGTVKRGLENLSPFIVYFIRIQYGKFVAEVFFRYRELKALDNYVRSTFPELKVTSFPKKKVFHQKTETIEGRVLEIEKFLQKILMNSAVRENPEIVLKFLNLPPNFYDLNNINSRDNSFFQNLNDVGEKLLRRFSVFRVLFEFFHTRRQIFSLLLPNNSSQELKLKERPIEIVAPDNSKHTIMINKFTKALDLCYEISQRLGLVSWLDFKLVLEKSEVEDRIVDDDEFIFKVLNIDEFLMENQVENPSFINKMYQFFQKGHIFLKNLFRPNYFLKWRKCIFMNNAIETIDYVRDPVKLNLMTSQVFQEISQNKFNLSLNDYSLFGALYAYISFGNLMEFQEEKIAQLVEEKVIFKIVPIKLFIQEKKRLWMDLIMVFWKKFSEEIEKIVQFNKFYNEGIEETIMASMMNPEQKTNENNNVNFKFKITDGQILGRMLVLKYVMASEDYGSKEYLVMYRRINKNKENAQQPKKVCKIMIKYNSVKILDDKKNLVEEIPLRKIYDLNVFPDYVEIGIKEKEDSIESFFYLFYSSESIHIYRALEIYSQIEILNKDLYKKYMKKLKENSVA